MVKVKVKLSQGYFALVDPEDLERVSTMKWSLMSTGGKKKYAKTGAKNDYITIHRFIMSAKNGQCVDHINGDGLDNRKKNLRIVSNAVNCRNRRGPNKNNTSGALCVYRVKGCKGWAAKICVDWEQRYLGIFKTKQEAEKAVISAKTSLKGGVPWPVS